MNGTWYWLNSTKWKGLQHWDYGKSGGDKIFPYQVSEMNQNDFVRWKCWCYLIFVSDFLVVLIFPEIVQIIFATMLVYNEGAACSKYEK